jgi:hypothetical protein
MTVASLRFEGKFFPEDSEEPFEEFSYSTEGERLPVLTLSFLWEGACLKEICQARLAGFAARGETIQQDRRLTLHTSDLCVVYAWLKGEDITIQVKEQVFTHQGHKVKALSNFIVEDEWKDLPSTSRLRMGGMIKIQQLVEPVRQMGHFTKVYKGGLVTNMIYPVRQTDAPHPSEDALRRKIEDVRNGKKMPYSIPKMAIGVIFARDVEWCQEDT